MQNLFKSLSVYKNPKILAVLFLGFASGLPLPLTGATLDAVLNQAGVAKTAIGLFALISVPYSLKFLWAPIIDRLPVPLLTRLIGRRRSWIILTQISLIASITMLGFSNPAENILTTALLALWVAFSSASQDIVIDAYRIESLEPTEQGAGASASTTGYIISMKIIGGALAFWLSDLMPWSYVYAIMAALMTLGIVAVMIAGEPPAKFISDKIDFLLFRKTLKEQVQKFLKQPDLWIAIILFSLYRIYENSIINLATLILTNHDVGSINQDVYITVLHWLERSIEKAIIITLIGRLFFYLFGKKIIEPLTIFAKQNKYWWVILVFIIFYKFGDAFAGKMTTPFLQDVGFTNSQIAFYLKTFGLGATLLGTFLGGAMVYKLGIFRALLIGGILQMASNLMFVLLAHHGGDTNIFATTVAVENLSGGMGTAALVAYLSSLCNVRYTATQYALLSSLASTGRTFLSASSGWFAQTLGWSNFFLLSAAISLPGIALLLLMIRTQKIK